MNKVLITIVEIVVALVVVGAVYFGIIKDTNKLGDTANAHASAIADVVSSEDVESVAVVKKYQDDPTVTVTVLDKSGNVMASLASVPSNATFDINAKTYDDYDRLSAITYQLR